MACVPVVQDRCGVPPESRSPLDDEFVAGRRTHIGNLLRDKRHAAGLSQESLAELAGVERKTISRAETGTHALTLDALIRIAHALQMSEGDLLNASHRRA